MTHENKPCIEKIIECPNKDCKDWHPNTNLKCNAEFIAFNKPISSCEKLIRYLQEQNHRSEPKCCDNCKAIDCCGLNWKEWGLVWDSSKDYCSKWEKREDEKIDYCPCGKKAENLYNEKPVCEQCYLVLVEHKRRINQDKKEQIDKKIDLFKDVFKNRVKLFQDELLAIADSYVKDIKRTIDDH